MPWKDQEYGEKQDGEERWDDSARLNKLQNPTLQKVEIWYEAERGIRGIKGYYAHDNGRVESGFMGVGVEEGLEPQIGFEVESSDSIEQIKGKYTTDGIVFLSFETQQKRFYTVGEAKTEGAKDFAVKCGAEEHFLGFYGEYKENLLTFGVYREKSRRFEFAIPFAESKDSVESDKVMSYSTKQYKVKSVMLWGDAHRIAAMQFGYMSTEKDGLTGKKHSSETPPNMKVQIMDLDPTEFLEEINGSYDAHSIKYLAFRTSENRILDVGVQKTGMARFHYQALEHNQLVVSEVGFADGLVKLKGFEVPWIIVNKNRGATFQDFERISSATASFKLEEPNEDEFKARRSLPTFDIKKLLFPNRKEVQQSVVMPSKASANLYQYAAEKRSLEKSFERNAVFAFLMWFGIGINITQILISISSQPNNTGVFVCSILLSIFAIGVFFYGLRIIDLKSLKAYNRYGLCLGGIILVSIILLLVALILEESIGLFCFSLITTVFLLPTYSKKRKILKEIYMFNPQKDDPSEHHNTSLIKEPQSTTQSFLVTEQPVSFAESTGPSRFSVVINGSDVRLDID